MKPKQILFLLFLLAAAAAPLRAQQGNPDSLRRIVRTLPESDTLHIRALLSLSMISIDSEPVLGRGYLDAALRLSERIGFTRGIATACVGIGKYLIDRRQLDSALLYINRGRAIYEELRWSKGLANVHNFLGMIRSMSGQHRQAVVEFTTAARIYESIGEKRLMAHAIGNSGVQYFDQGVIDSAAAVFERALRISEETGDKNAEANWSVNLANALVNDSIAVVYYERGLKLYEVTGNHNGANHALYLLGSMQAKSGDRECARKTLGQVVEKSRELRNPETLAGALNELGNMDRQDGDVKSALDRFETALEIAKETGQTRMRAIVLTNLGHLFAGAANYPLAIRYAEEALSTARTVNDRDRVQATLLLLADLNQAAGDPGTALAHHRAASTLRDSMYSQNSAKYMLGLLAQYEADKREKELRLLRAGQALKEAELRSQSAELARRALESLQQDQQLALLARERDLERSYANQTRTELALQKESAARREKDHQLQGSLLSRERLLRNTALGGTGLLLMIGWLGVRRIRDRRRAAELRAESTDAKARLAEARAASLEADNERREKEAQRLLTQRLLEAQERTHQRIAADLHDGLGQGLLVIKNATSMALRNSPLPENTRSQLEALTEAADVSLADLRQIVRELRPAQLDRFGLSETIRSMMQQLGDTTDVHFTGLVEDVDAGFSEGSDINVFRIVQEAVNNIVKHSGAQNATVQVLNTADGVSIDVEDDGCGFDPSMLNSDSSRSMTFGLDGMAERVRILNGRMTIDSAPGRGTRLNVRLPASGNPHRSLAGN